MISFTLNVLGRSNKNRNVVHGIAILKHILFCNLVLYVRMYIEWEYALLSIPCRKLSYSPFFTLRCIRCVCSYKIFSWLGRREREVWFGIYCSVLIDGCSSQFYLLRFFVVSWNNFVLYTHCTTWYFIDSNSLTLYICAYVLTESYTYLCMYIYTTLLPPKKSLWPMTKQQNNETKYKED